MIDNRFSQIRIVFVAAILLASGIIYLILPFAAVRWAQTPFAGFLMDPNLVISDTGRSHWPPKQIEPPVAYPEKLTAVNDSPVRDLQDFQAMMAASQVEDEVAFTLSQPENSRILPIGEAAGQRMVTVPLIKVGLVDIWNHFWLFYIVGTLTLLFGAWAFIMRPDAEAAQMFALLAATGALAIGGLFDLVTTQWFVRIWIVALSLFGSFNLLLVFVFPHEIDLIHRRPQLKWLVLMPGLVIVIWAELWLRHPTDSWAYAIPWRAAYFLNGAYLILSLSILTYRSFWSPSPLVRQQGRLILVGGFLALLPLLLFFLLASISVRVAWLTELFFVPLTVIYPLSIAYTIVRYRLLDIDFVVRRGVAYAFLTGLLIGALTLGISGLRTVLAPYIDVNSPIFWAVIIVIVAAIYDPLRSRLQEGLDRAFFRQPVAFDDLLRSYNRDLKTAVDADEVATKLLDYAQAGVTGTTPTLFLPDNKMSCYSSYDDSNDMMLDMKSPVVAFLRDQTGVIDLAEERAWPDTLRQHSDTMAALESAAIVPMNNGQELLGWLSLPPKNGGQHFTPMELSYLSSLADQSLIGLERANVIRRLETRIAESDLLSQFSQHLNFTIEFDDMLELTYVNYYRLLGIEDFFISWSDPDTNRVYRVFHVEDGERIHECEGQDKIIQDERILQVVKTGQMLVTAGENGRSWIIAPLNAGANTLGAIHAVSPIPLLAREEQLFGSFADRTAVALERFQTRRELEERAQQLEIINEVTGSLAATLELDPLLNLILDKSMEMLDTEAGTFMMSDEDTGELEFRVVRGPASERLIGTRLPIGTGLSGTAAQTGRPSLVNHVEDDERWFNLVDDDAHFKTHSILTVPLLRQSTVLGVVQLINKRNGAPFDDEDKRLLMAFAGQAVVALENVRLWEQTDKALQERVSELFLLQQLDRDLNTSLNLDHVLNLTLDWVLRICNGSAGAIVLIDEEGRPRLRTSQGYDPAFDPDSINGGGLPNGLIGRALRTGEPHVSGNVHEEPDYVEAAYTTHAQMTIPIVHKQQMLGAIAIEADELGVFDSVSLDTAVRVINHAAVAITNAVLYNQIQEANQAKSEFVSMVSHELKTPLTSVGGYTDLILTGMTGPLSDQQQNFLETISVNIKRMGQLIQDLTDISRIETKHLHVELTPVSLTKVISDTMQIVRGPCDAKEINALLDLQTDVPLVLGDKERLVQVMTNLLSNACKYSPSESTVQLTIRTEMMALKHDEPEIPMVICSVKDEGYGISEENQKQLFTKFFRADDPNIRKASGTGLGLSITKGIVELHNGRIWVQSQLGRGTTFHFALPQVID